MKIMKEKSCRTPEISGMNIHNIDQYLKHLKSLQKKKGPQFKGKISKG